MLYLLFGLCWVDKFRRRVLVPFGRSHSCFSFCHLQSFSFIFLSKVCFREDDKMGPGLGRLISKLHMFGWN